MSRLVLLTAVPALALSGCGSRGGNESANAANASVSGRTENGQITARVQGVDLKVNLPPPLRRMAEDNPYLYPGARIIRDAPPPAQHFTSPDSPETVARWYRDPARASRFTIADARQQGSLLEMNGSGRNGDSLAVALSPAAGGGTEISILTTGH